MACLTCTGSATTTFIIKRGDLDPPIRAQIVEDGQAESLALALSVRFIMRNVRTGALVISQVAQIENQTLNPGVVEYSWSAGDTDIPGFYLGEFEVTWSDTYSQTFPANCYLSIVVTRDLDLIIVPEDPDPDNDQLFEGHGPPGEILGAKPGDEYIDVDTGDIYEFE